MYVDRDGDTILETIEELTEWHPSCPQCESEKQEMLSVLTMPGVRPTKLVFTTTCAHR